MEDSYGIGLRLLYIITAANRSLGARYPLQYNIYATRKKLVVPMIIVLVLSTVVIGVGSGWHSLHYDHHHYLTILDIYVYTSAVPWMVAYALYVVFCVFTYTTIYARLDKSRKTVSHQVRDSFPEKSNNPWRGGSKKLFLILISYCMICNMLLMSILM